MDALPEDEHMSTTETPTAHQLQTLHQEASDHGDLEQVAICDRAMAGDAAAIDECARVLADAMAAAWEPALSTAWDAARGGK